MAENKYKEWPSQSIGDLNLPFNPAAQPNSVKKSINLKKKLKKFLFPKKKSLILKDSVPTSSLSLDKIQEANINSINSSLCEKTKCDDLHLFAINKIDSILSNNKSIEIKNINHNDLDNQSIISCSKQMNNELNKEVKTSSFCENNNIDNLNKLTNDEYKCLNSLNIHSICQNNLKVIENEAIFSQENNLDVSDDNCLFAYDNHESDTKLFVNTQLDKLDNKSIKCQNNNLNDKDTNIPFPDNCENFCILTKQEDISNTRKQINLYDSLADTTLSFNLKHSHLDKENQTEKNADVSEAEIISRYKETCRRTIGKFRRRHQLQLINLVNQINSLKKNVEILQEQVGTANEMVNHVTRTNDSLEARLKQSSDAQHLISDLQQQLDNEINKNTYLMGEKEEFWSVVEMLFDKLTESETRCDKLKKLYYESKVNFLDESKSSAEMKVQEAEERLAILQQLKNTSKNGNVGFLQTIKIEEKNIELTIENRSLTEEILCLKTKFDLLDALQLNL